MEFLGLHIAGSLILILFGFGVGRKWESLNSPSDIVTAYLRRRLAVHHCGGT